MMNIRTAQAPARQTMSVRELFGAYGDRTAPHTPDVISDQAANPLRELLDGAPGKGEGEGGDAWRTLLMKQPDEQMDANDLLRLLGSLGRTSALTGF